MRLHTILFSTLLLMSSQSFAQTNDKDKKDENDLMSLLNEDAPAKKTFATATFKTTRIGNGHSIENVAKGVLDVRISHRFGTINGGSYELFGLDQAQMRIGLDYGISDRLMIGLGRSSYQKEYDGFIKYKILRQVMEKKWSFGLSYAGGMSSQTIKVPYDNYDPGYRVAYFNQLILAKKINTNISLQLMPTHVHYNMVDLKKDPNDIYALGIGGRVKLTNRLSLNCEYFHQLNQFDGTTNCLTLGIDVETGGHVFQFVFTNSTGITERNFVGQTTGDWGNGDIHFGFNISRVFTVVKPKGFENSRTKIW
jgi:hypothetical protein